MGQAFWTGVRLPSSPPASDRIAAMRFFFCFIWEERMERGIWIANKKREVKAFFIYEEAKARCARMKAGDDLADGKGPICGSAIFFILTLIDVHDTIQIENIRYYKRRYRP